MTSRALQRVLIFLVGGILTYPAFGYQDLGLVIALFISGGVAAWLVYEIMLRTRRWLRLYTLPVYWLVARVIMDLANRIGSLLYFSVDAGYLLSLDRVLSELWWLDPQSWDYWFANPAWLHSLQIGLIQSALLVLFVYLLLRVPGAAVSAPMVRAPNVASVSQGYGGIAMDPKQSQTTRFLLASTFLLGSSFRTRILNYVRDTNRAIAPEPGLDLALIARVCKFIEDRDVGYQLLFVGLGVVAIIVALFGLPVLALVGFVLGAWIIQGYKAFQEQHRSLDYFAKGRYDPATVAGRFDANLDTDIIEGIPQEGQNVREAADTGFGARLCQMKTHGP